MNYTLNFSGASVFCVNHTTLEDSLFIFFCLSYFPIDFFHVRKVLTPISGIDQKRLCVCIAKLSLYTK